MRAVFTLCSPHNLLYLGVNVTTKAFSLEAIMYQQYGLTPPPASVPTGIRWHPLTDYLFTEPVRFTAQWVPTVQGIYAITVPDENWGPRKFRPLYFGEASDLKERLTWAHEKSADWVREARTLPVYVSIYLTLGKSEDERRAIEEKFIAHYCPPCNVKANPLSNLAALMRNNPYGSLR